MASSFVHKPTTHTGATMSIDDWIHIVWDLIPAGPYAATITASNNEKMPLRYTAVLFRRFQPTAAREGAYSATPTAIVDFREAFPATLDGRLNRWGARRGDVLVPLGSLGISRLECQTVLQQCARQWVTGGAISLAGNMSDENVTTMYYAALQCLVYTTASGQDPNNVRQWFQATLALTAALKKFCDESEIARAVTAALANTSGADDTLQRAIAAQFTPNFVWSEEFKLELLETVVRRSTRRNSTTIGMDAGPFAVFTIVPLLREFVTSEQGTLFSLNEQTLYDKFNAQTSELLQEYIKGATSNKEEMTVSSLHTLATKAAGLSLTKDHVRKLLQHIVLNPEMGHVAPWAEWGVLPVSSILACNVRVDRFAISGKPSASYQATLKPITTNSFQVKSYKGTDWSAIQFCSNGRYTVSTTCLGIATAAQGQTLGLELVANWRVTLGDDILPLDKPGISAAGMEYSPKLRKYVRAYEPFDFTKPFVVEITDERVYVNQVDNHDEAVVYPKVKGQPVLLGFKNLVLDVQFVAHAPQPQPLDLPPTALLAKLRELAAAP